MKSKALKHIPKSMKSPEIGKTFASNQMSFTKKEKLKKSEGLEPRGGKAAKQK